MPRLPWTSTDGPEPTWPLTCGFRSPATPNEPQFCAYSALAYAAYAGWRDASGPRAAPSRRRARPGPRCIGQPYACPCSCPTQPLGGVHGWDARKALLTVPVDAPVPKCSTDGSYGHSPTSPLLVCPVPVHPVPGHRSSCGDRLGFCHTHREGERVPVTVGCWVCSRSGGASTGHRSRWLSLAIRFGINQLGGTGKPVTNEVDERPSSAVLG